MKIANAANIVKSCIASSDIIPVLKNLCINSGKLLSFNGAQGISAKIDLEDIRCVVNGDALVKIVNSIPHDKIELAMKSKEELVISSSTKKRSSGSKTKVSLVAQPVKSFKSFVFKTEPDEVLCSFKLTEDVIYGIANCVSAVSESNMDAALGGVALCFENKKLKLYATDTVRMSRYECDVKVTSSRPKFQILMPRAYCSLVTSLAKHIVGHTVTVGVNSIVINTDELSLFTTTPQSVDFPDYEGVINKFNNDDNFCPVPARFIEALNRCLVILVEAQGRVTVSFEGDNMTVKADSYIGSVVERVTLKSRFDLQPLDFSAEFLKQTLSLIEQMSFVRHAKSEITAIVGRKDRLLNILACSNPEKRQASSDSEEE